MGNTPPSHMCVIQEYQHTLASSNVSELGSESEI